MKVLPFACMNVIDNAYENTELEGSARIIGINSTAPNPTVWLIDLQRPHKNKPSYRKAYFKSPYLFSLGLLIKLIESNKCRVVAASIDPLLLLKDSDRLDTCTSEEKRKKLISHFQIRDKRFSIIKPLVCDENGTPFPAGKLMEDNEFPVRLKIHAANAGISEQTIRNWIHKYWSAANHKSALMPKYEGRSGGPGQIKKQRIKIGRIPRLYIQGEQPSRGYVLTEEDKKRLAFGYGLISREITPYEAYLQTSACFWSDLDENLDGKKRNVLYPKYLRPSFDQFKRWGQRLIGVAIREIMQGPRLTKQSKKATGGSEQDSIMAIGQQAMFDSTSNDVYLVSYRDRGKKLPPMTRLVIRESRVGLIYGLYCGWERASQTTALLAIIHGAMPDKVEWARRFGVEITRDAIPGLLAKNTLGDNGEMKGEAITAFAEEFGVGISFAPNGQGEAKGGIESSHRTVHRRVDHNLPGTTHGKQRTRGEKHAALSALWNYYEYMSKLINYIVFHNTEEEVPDQAPDDMLMHTPRIRPTRINIYKWLNSQGLNASVQYDYQALRAYALPTREAVVCKNGIRLVVKIQGRKTYLPRLRYTSKALAETGLLSQVKRTGKTIPTILKIDDNDLSKAWAVTRLGLIEVFNSSRDTIINNKITLQEWIDYVQEQQILGDLAEARKEQMASERTMLDQAITYTAKKEIETQKSHQSKKTSNRSIKINLKRNREEEMENLRLQDSWLPKIPKSSATFTEQPNSQDIQPDTESIADDVMISYHLQGVDNA
ncbi:hypothetical protein [Delftia tsuruhatensis]|uniref:hypothetical protein n=1 Tax=Delftia tsuruhatensis TaxID=180282 RepID=UPI002091136B|nr:hypothetical protein [Delftia tsuruhatensis]MCO5337583.1 hypothetical protein [Delftia tsuruhatensis]MCR4548252.1 hypothetical protein [Delftia tsuruhatensis]